MSSRVGAPWVLAFMAFSLLAIGERAATARACGSSGSPETKLLEEVLDGSSLLQGNIEPSDRRGCPNLVAPVIRWQVATPWGRNLCDPALTVDSVCAAADAYCSQRSAGQHSCSFGLGIPNPCPSEESVTQTHRPILEYAGRRFAAYVASREMQEQCCGAGTTASETACRTQFNQTELKVNLGLGADESTGYFGNSSTDTAIHVSLGILVNCTSTDCVDRLFLHELGHACHYLKNQTQQTLPYSESDTRRDFVAARGEDVTQCVQTALQTERNRASQGQQLLNINAEEWFEEALADATFFHLWTTPGSWAWNCNAHQDELHSNPRIYMACLFRIPAVRQNLCGAQGS